MSQRQFAFHQRQRRRSATCPDLFGGQLEGPLEDLLDSHPICDTQMPLDANFNPHDLCNGVEGWDAWRR